MDHIDIPHPLMFHLPRFVPVQKLDLILTGAGKHFLKCTRCSQQQEGVPCPCFFRISDNAGVKREQIIDLGMVDARYLKFFNSHYGEEGPIGNILHKAQKEYFENE